MHKVIVSQVLHQHLDSLRHRPFHFLGDHYDRAPNATQFGVELIDRRITGNTFHYYLNPERDIDRGAQAVHGIRRDFLNDKPLFIDIVNEFLEYIKGAELVIHNAKFDLGFLNNELKQTKQRLGTVEKYCQHIDTLKMARDKHPGQRNNLDALCKRYNIDNTHRQLHGALLDANILARVYLAMTGGQTSLLEEVAEPVVAANADKVTETSNIPTARKPLTVIAADADELAKHQQRLDAIDETSGGQCVWKDDGK